MLPSSLGNLKLASRGVAAAGGNKEKSSCIRRLLGNEGVARARGSCHDVSVIGVNGIYTSGQGSVLTISANGLSIFDYIVAEDGTGQFLTLGDAVAQIIADDANGVNVLVKPGHYELPDLENSRHINFISASFTTEPTAVLHGETNSHGNKNWVGFIFQGSREDVSDGAEFYHINNLASNELLVDYFFNCVFMRNFRLETTNDILVFDNCFFNYDDIIRDRLIIVHPGTGKIECFNCSFNVSRYGSTAAANATNFISMEGNTQNTSTIFLDCNVVMVVQGPTAYRFANVFGSQTVNIQNFNVRIRQSNSGDIVMFGHESYAPDINLVITGGNFSVEAGSETAVVTFLSNLWSPPAINGVYRSISISSCIFSGMRLLYYDPTTQNRVQYLKVSNCTLSSGTESAININMAAGSVFNLELVLSDFHSFALHKPFMLVGGTGGTVNLTAVLIHLKYAFPTVGCPPCNGVGDPPPIQWWGETNDTVAVHIRYNDVVTDGFTTQFVRAQEPVTKLPDDVTGGPPP